MRSIGALVCVLIGHDDGRYGDLSLSDLNSHPDSLLCVPHHLGANTHCHYAPSPSNGTTRRPGPLPPRPPFSLSLSLPSAVQAIPRRTGLTWEAHGSYRARVEKVEPPHAFAFRWIRRIGAEPREGNSTLVAFSVSAEGERTRLRVVESGFPELDWSGDEKAQYAEENKQGWQVELDELREYVSKRFGGSGRG